MKYVIWHNPRCSKSRAALAILEEAGVPLEVRRYLDAPPPLVELQRVVEALGDADPPLLRAGEALAGELGLTAADAARPDLAELLHEYPRLIERPVVLASDGRVVIGRPPERVRELL